MSPQQRRAFLTEGTRTAKVATVMADGAPHVMPIWFVLDGDDLIFNTGADTVKGRALRRDPRIALLVDDERPPFAFVHIRGRVELSEDPQELLQWATRIGRRYMGQERAREFGARNGVPGELVVRVVPERIIAEADLAD